MKTICDRIRWFYAWVCRIELTLSMVNLCLSTFFIFLSAIMRYLGKPINWSLEISLLLFAWCVFLSADVGLREDRLVNLDMAVARLPRKLRIWVNIFSNSLIFAFLVAMAYYGITLSIKSYVRTFQGIPNFSYSWVTLSLPVAAILMLVTISLKTAKLFRQLSEPDDEQTAKDTA